MKNPILRISFMKNRRIIVVSDIHGNLEYFNGLLKKIEFTQNDILVINGDFLERGHNNIALLRKVMEMHRSGNTFVVRGNCDGWHEFLDRGSEMDNFIADYMQERPNCFLRNICDDWGMVFTNADDIPKFKEILSSDYAEEMEFLRNLPVIIETDFYTFAHGGVSSNDIDSVNPYSCMKNDNFLGQHLSFDKWMIVGHWPVVLYHHKAPDANPIILKDRKIVSIDGGCVLVDDGQLNALIIPNNGSDDFECVHYDHFPLAKALDCQEQSDNSYYIRWGDNEVDILDRHFDFHCCKHKRTGHVMDILKKNVYETPVKVTVNDCTDYRHEICEGDIISIVEESSLGYYCKKNGVSGWYSGRIEYLD